MTNLSLLCWCFSNLVRVQLARFLKRITIGGERRSERQLRSTVFELFSLFGISRLQELHVIAWCPCWASNQLRSSNHLCVSWRFGQFFIFKLNKQRDVNKSELTATCKMHVAWNYCHYYELRNDFCRIFKPNLFQCKVRVSESSSYIR